MKQVKPQVIAANPPIYPKENVVTARYARRAGSLIPYLTIIGLLDSCRELQLREWLDSQEVGATKAQFATFSSSITKEVTKVSLIQLLASLVICLSCHTFRPVIRGLSTSYVPSILVTVTVSESNLTHTIHIERSRRHNLRGVEAPEA